MYPFFWSREAVATGAAAMRLGFGLAETTLASAQVIGHRLPIIGDACADPLSADHGELALMVTEKAQAFSRAGAALGQTALAAQLELAGQWAALLGSGPSLVLGRRAARATARNLAAAGEALSPIRTAATSNARRLGREKRRRR